MAVPLLITVILGFLCCFGGIWTILRLTARSKSETHRGWDHPDDLRKTHPKAVPRLGGVAVFGTFAILAGGMAILEEIPNLESLGAVSLGGALIFLLGLWDDLVPLSAKIKLAAQVLIAILMWILGLRIDLVTNPVSGAAVTLAPAISFAVTVLWLVAIPNVINLADGMDGLAGGIGLFLFITLGIVGALSEFQQGLGFLSFGLAGATVAFLCFNFPPARIFLGDGGAYFIGFFIAAATIDSSQKSYVGASLTVTLIALGVPILDTIFAFGRRFLKGVPVMRGDSDHIHHRLLLIGMSSGKALFVLYGVFIALAVLALSTIFNKSLSIGLSVGFLILVALIALRGLGYVGKFRTLPADLKRILGTRKEVRFAVLVSQALEMEVVRQKKHATFWEIFEHEMRRLNLSNTLDSNGPTVVFHFPFKGVVSWKIASLGALPDGELTGESGSLARETVASCFVTPLCLGIKKFGAPNWRGLTTVDSSPAKAPESQEKSELTPGR